MACDGHNFMPWGMKRSREERKMSSVQARVTATLLAVSLGLGSAAAFAGTKVVNGTEVRDWESVDANKDGSISPEEMEKFLQATWAKSKPK